jgi:hypothetical protein
MGRVPTENVTSQGKTPNNLLYIDTNNFNGIQGFPTWNEIYRIFVNEYIHAIPARPIFFPYNYEVICVYHHLESNNATTMNPVPIPTSSSHPDDIHTRYQFQEPIHI